MRFNDNSIAEIFPGQASQESKMGYEAHELNARARDIFDIASEASDANIREFAWNSEPKDMKGPLVQPALGAAILAEHELKVQLGLKPDLIMGHSVSEIIALCAAGAFTLEDTFNILTVRGRAMEEAQKLNPGIMTAFIGATSAEFEWVLNYANRRAEKLKTSKAYSGMVNWSRQHVASGDEGTIRLMEVTFELLQRLKKVGRVTSRLVKDDGAAHTEFMQPAVELVYEEIARANKKTPDVPVLANNGRFLTDPSKYADYLSDQLKKPADWHLSMWIAVLNGVRQFVEVGPKKILTNINKQEFPGQTAMHDLFGRIVQIEAVPELPEEILEKIMELAA